MSLIQTARIPACITSLVGFSIKKIGINCSGKAFIIYFLPCAKGYIVLLALLCLQRMSLTLL